jgi:DNA-binding XRE family transcriptional regulator
MNTMELITVSNTNPSTPQKLPLRHVRASLGLRQKDVAQEANIEVSTYIKIEKKQAKPRVLTAYAIVDALNKVRKERNLPEIDVNAIDWEIL